MKIVCDRDDLHRALLLVGRAIPTRPHLTELGRVVLEAANDHLTLVGTDLRLGVRHTIAATVIAPGALCVAARFVELVDSLPSGDVLMELVAARSVLRISIQGYSCDVRSFDVDDFPAAVPAGAVQHAARIEARRLKQAIQEVSYVARRDDARPALGGVLFEIDSTIRLIATDNYRVVTDSLVADSSSLFTALIPAENLNEVERVLDTTSSSMVHIGATAGTRQVVFTVGDTTIASGVIAGQLPDLGIIEALTFDTLVRVERERLLRAVQVANYFAGVQGLRLDFRPSAGLLQVSARHPEEGQTALQVSVSGSGRDVVVDVHASNFAEVLMRLADVEVEVRLAGASHVGVFAYAGTYRQVMRPLTLIGPGRTAPTEPDVG